MPDYKAMATAVTAAFTASFGAFLLLLLSKAKMTPKKNVGVKLLLTPSLLAIEPDKC